MHQIAADWRQATLSDANRALCLFAERLTLQAANAKPAWLDELRQHGFDDRAIHDATQVISLFNYINRVADALGVEQEDFIRAWEKSPDP